MIALVLDLDFSTETIVALITLAGVIFSGIVSMLAMLHARGSNKAVNGVGPNEPRMYDLAFSTHKKVLGLEQWREQYTGGSLDSGQKVETFMKEFEQVREGCAGLKDQLHEIREDVKRYGCPVKLGEEEKCKKEA
jgi:hypothetical protein